MIRVLVVDDSALMRRLITTALMLDPEIEIAGTAVNGRDAVQRLNEINPDAVTLDIEMPLLDGIGALIEIRKLQPQLPVIMFSTLTEKGATKTLEALSRGASDFVTKPSNTTSMEASMASVREQLIPKIKALTAVRRLAEAARPKPIETPSTSTAPTAPSSAASTRAVPPTPPPAPAVPPGPPEVLLVGASTGGPDAWARVLESLPADFPLPILMVQHMPPLFTTMFAERLDRNSPLSVREAQDGDVPKAGEVLIAPGGLHMRLTKSGTSIRVALDEGPPENFCRPAVDALFRSAVPIYGGRSVVLILTGMGQDGLEGTRPLVELGAQVIVQDEASSVVWGMPGAVASAGLAHQVLGLEKVATAVTLACRGGASRRENAAAPAAPRVGAAVR